ncbi:ribbon-helix-helix domain-containing protein [Kitasatospora purpeofusca]|uniref:ribbon-helix-helix domain-containing protein n=1 Tax=Kitasatospora purpeofusca TaxID=67352 RepID=UPI00225135F4|nr:CopG family transcriptional regulator [Kitasatospora purpeofusca]MCX4689074.1 ribbon-helix-helix domain-containing protein [Kitasatospora purpeofusca]
MTLKRTTVYVEAEDLAVIKEAAAREGIAEAEIIREGIHLAAMARRVWNEPFFSSTYEPVGDATEEDIWAEKAAAYERTKHAAPTSTERGAA